MKDLLVEIDMKFLEVRDSIKSYAYILYTNRIQMGRTAGMITLKGIEKMISLEEV
jgi:hypothetical protein